MTKTRWKIYQEIVLVLTIAIRRIIHLFIWFSKITIKKNRSSSSEVLLFYKKGTLKNLAKFKRKCLCQSLFSNKATRSRHVTLLKKRLKYKCFPVNFAKFLGTPIWQNTCERLLLKNGQNVVINGGLIKSFSERIYCIPCLIPACDRVNFLSRWAGQYCNNFSYLKSYNLILNMISTPLAFDWFLFLFGLSYMHSCFHLDTNIQLQ